MTKTMTIDEAITQLTTTKPHRPNIPETMALAATMLRVRGAIERDRAEYEAILERHRAEISAFLASKRVPIARVTAMPTLPNHPNLRDFQQYVTEMEVERGFNDQTVLQKCLLLGEEVGELFKAIRKNSNMQLDLNSKVGSIDEELADILIYLCAIANKLDVNLETAFRDKEEVNKTRNWTLG